MADALAQLFMTSKSAVFVGSCLMLGLISIIVSIGFYLIGVVKLARDVIEEANTAKLRDMARAFILLRDLMNTPLQTIEFSIALLRRGNASSDAALDRIDNAVSQIGKLNAALSQYEKDVDWDQNDNFITMN